MQLICILLYLSIPFADGVDDDLTLPPVGCHNRGACAEGGLTEVPYQKEEPPGSGTMIGSTMWNCTNCVCVVGYTGERCETVSPICTETSCPSDHFVCVVTGLEFECHCTAAWTGADCSIEVSGSCLSSPCLNRGICNPAGVPLCTCQPGFVGEFCQYSDPCLSTPCLNSGVCQVSNDNFLCNCSSSWQGRFCNESSFELKSSSEYCAEFGDDKDAMFSTCSPDMNLALCLVNLKTRFPNNYNYLTVSDECCYLSWRELHKNNLLNCACKLNDNCTIVKVYAYPILTPELSQCLPGNNNCTLGQSQCVEQLKGFSCLCYPGFGGIDCKKQQEICVSNPCVNNGTCIDVTVNNFSYYTCECEVGYTGTTCDVQLPCYSANCSSTEICVEPDGCICRPPWTSAGCQDYDACFVEPCFNGVCTNIPNGYSSDYSCSCEPGFTGRRCGINIDECSSNPCLNGGTCIDGINAFNCTCVFGTFGDTCELNPNDCDMNECSYSEEGVYSCPDGSPGPINLNTAPEKNHCTKIDINAICIDGFGGYKCQCSSKYTGTHCELRSPGGLLAKVNVNKDQYVPWTDTSGIRVFVHSKDEIIMSESVRYDCAPRGESILDVKKKKYKKLGGRFGACVKDKSEVKFYYYSGGYTTGACYRSCYQSIIEKSCQCMDPSYPMASNSTPCDLQKRACLFEAARTAGDPSSWSWCVCPPACEVNLFEVSVNRAEYRKKELACSEITNVTKWEECIAENQDNVRVLVRLVQLETKTYSEIPLLDVTI